MTQPGAVTTLKSLFMTAHTTLTLEHENTVLKGK